MQVSVASDPRRLGRLLLNGLIFVALPICVLIPFLTAAYHKGDLGLDFDRYMLPAARLVASGASPYPGYGYPPLVAFALVPFTWLPGPNIVYCVLLIACVPLSLRLLGVTDWRCYGIVFLWTPVLTGVQSGNVTIPLLLGAAICWHARTRWKTTAIAGGLTVAAKLLSWPLVVWLAATRRFRAAIGAVVLAAVVSVVLWSVLGFSSMVDYPARLSAAGRGSSPESYTVKVLLQDLGVGAAPARLAMAFVAAAVLAGVVWFGWRGDDRRSFALAGLAMIVASPIVWMHSFVLLLIPVAVMRPRLSAAWLLPVAFLIGAGTGNGAPWQTAGVLALSVLTVALALLPPRRRPALPVPGQVQPSTTAPGSW